MLFRCSFQFLFYYYRLALWCYRTGVLKASGSFDHSKVNPCMSSIVAIDPSARNHETYQFRRMVEAGGLSRDKKKKSVDFLRQGWESSELDYHFIKNYEA